MRFFRRCAAGTDATEIATHAGFNVHGVVSASVSVVALLFSGFSLWETSLKQADLTVYVTGVVTYERDLTAAEYITPAGGFEVFAVPVTIANGGARDAAVLSLQLDAVNPKTGLAARFEATYTADGTYFANTGDKRPKTPFSALVIAGRSVWTGTVLFYPVSYSNGKALAPVVKVRDLNDALRKKYAVEMGGSSSITVLREKLPNAPELADLDAYTAKVMNQNDKADLTLKLVSPAPKGWLDRALEAPVQPVDLTLNMPDIPDGRVERGERVRLRASLGSRADTTL
jgi:hypothetical protein